MPTTTGLRERKKEATRKALHEAAVRLAVEHGPDAVTVEAIADAANVSRRTFSNYFAGKEEALFHIDRLQTRRLLDLVSARPADEPIWTALSRSAEQLTADSDVDPDWQAHLTLLRRHPSLIGRRVAIHAEAEQSLTDAVARRLSARPTPSGDVDLLARLLAAALLMTFRVATRHALDHPDRPLADVLHEALTTLHPTP